MAVHLTSETGQWVHRGIIRSYRVLNKPPAGKSTIRIVKNREIATNRANMLWKWSKADLTKNKTLENLVVCEKWLKIINSNDKN